MKNGIIINGTAYEMVETDSLLHVEVVCEKCAFLTRCEELGKYPCDLFRTKYFRYFVKVEETK